MTHPKADGVTITCEKCGAFDWRPADGNGGGGGRGCICPKADGLSLLDKFLLLFKRGIVAKPGVIIRVQNGKVISRVDTGDKTQGGRIIHE